MRPNILIIGMGRSGTTAIAQVLSSHNKLLYVDEPNFIDALYFPFASARITPESFLAGADEEGWRGSMKFCRSLTEMYPLVFGDGLPHSVRSFMQKEITRLIRKGASLTVRHRSELIADSLHQIVEWSCRAAKKKRWLIKQPRMALCCEEIARIFGNILVVHVARRLEYVLRSRLVRGYQGDLVDALQVCMERLHAAARLNRCLPKATVMHVRIEDVARAPSDWIRDICLFCDLEVTAAVLIAAESITEDALYSLGPAEDFFNAAENKLIQEAREKINREFGKELV